MEAILRREGITLSQWIARQIARAGAPARASAQARAEVEDVKALRVQCGALHAEVARLRAAKDRTVVISSGAMTVLEHLFPQCVRLWPEYQNGFSQWLSDSAISFWVLNGYSLGLDLGRHADGALSATPMLRALVCRVVQDLVLPKRRC